MVGVSPPLPRSGRPSCRQHEFLDGSRQCRRRVRSLMGCAGRGKGTTVGDGGDGLAGSKGWRFSLCRLRMVSTGSRRQARPPMGSAVSTEGARPSETVVMGSLGARVGAPASATWRWQRRLCVFKRKAGGRPAAVAAAVAGITSAPSAKALGAEKWEAESSLLPLSTMSEKYEPSVGWGRS